MGNEPVGVLLMSLSSAAVLREMPAYLVSVRGGWA